MIHKKEDIINFIGTTFFIVLFWVVLSSFSDKPVKQMNTAYQYELLSAYHSNNANAVTLDAIQSPSVQKSCVLLLNHFFNENHKILADNRKIATRILFLQKTQLLIKPETTYRFCYHLFSGDDEDLPFLS